MTDARADFEERTREMLGTIHWKAYFSPWPTMIVPALTEAERAELLRLARNTVGRVVVVD